MSCKRYWSIISAVYEHISCTYVHMCSVWWCIELLFSHAMNQKYFYRFLSGAWCRWCCLYTHKTRHTTHTHTHTENWALTAWCRATQIHSLLFHRYDIVFWRGWCNMVGMRSSWFLWSNVFVYIREVDASVRFQRDAFSHSMICGYKLYVCIQQNHSGRLCARARSKVLWCATVQ